MHGTTTPARHQVNWPWRILFLLVLFPLTVIAVGASVQNAYPHLVGQEVTDEGQRIVTWTTEGDENADQWAVWCRAVSHPAEGDSPAMRAHLAQLRDSAMYADRC